MPRRGIIGPNSACPHANVNSFPSDQGASCIWKLWPATVLVYRLVALARKQFRIARDPPRVNSVFCTLDGGHIVHQDNPIVAKAVTVFLQLLTLNIDRAQAANQQLIASFDHHSQIYTSALITIYAAMYRAAPH